MNKWHKGLFFITSNEVIWPPKNSNLMQRLKSAILAIFEKGRDGRTLLVQPSRIPCWISKNLFVLCSYEFLVMLQGKIRNGPFFQGSIW